MQYDPLKDGLSNIQLLEHGNDDLAVVNAARVSFAKHHDTFDESDAKLLKYLAAHQHWTPFGTVQIAQPFSMFLTPFVQWREATQNFNFRTVSRIDGSIVHGWLCGSLYSHVQAAKAYNTTSLLYEDVVKSLDAFEVAPRGLRPGFDPRNETTINMIREDVLRITAQEMRSLVTATVRIKMPIFVERQWTTHKQNLFHGGADISRNEVSRRYVDSAPEFYIPQSLRLRAENKKQGSSEDSIYELGYVDPVLISSTYDSEYARQLHLYNELLDYHVAPELARVHLGLGTYTEFWETGSLDAWSRVCRLRMDSHAQAEIRVYAEALDKILAERYGVIWRG